MRESLLNPSLHSFPCTSRYLLGFFVGIHSAGSIAHVIVNSTLPFHIKKSVGFSCFIVKRGSYKILSAHNKAKD
ncbi:hypothetical protein ACN38_g1194 [Penicillium nordicum]|uniref:Uncharacterized protein n=1 Tax=Penicillium nordicum TaxID=229535 RepID=A0A0M8P985_9EURO|nr:hypothetical protein ACN38_g1194 [Penicillium nordicum]